MLKQINKRNFGLFAHLKNFYKTPAKYGRNLWGNSIGNDAPISHLTDKFEDEAAEWKSVIVENSYELNTFQNYEQNIQNNFGTLDNPHLIFTSDLPYRFVGCTGPPNEDDYEGHEIMYFMLREGPLQRCMSCGQVFKLIRLRDEYSAENDYYQDDFVKKDIEEMGQADHWIQLNIIRFMMLHSYEHTHFEVATNTAISLRNNDDHDRILVDPAYRLEQLSIAEHKANVLANITNLVEKASEEQHGRNQVEYSRDTYENVINAEIAMAELDQYFKNVTRFNIRQFLDPKNHERREKRMLERANERINLQQTVYLQGVSESELQYRDYFESDSEAINALDISRAEVKQKVLQNTDYQIKNFNFQEQHSEINEPDGASYIKRKVFRFNYRQAFVTPEDHHRKETRMIEKMKNSGFLEQLNEFIGDSSFEKQIKTTNHKKPSEFYDFVINQATDNYRNYFESDLEEDFEYIAQLPASEKKEFLQTFTENHFIEKKIDSKASFLSFPKPVENDQGLLVSGIDFWGYTNEVVIPVFNVLNGVNMDKQAISEVIQKLENESKKLNDK